MSWLWKREIRQSQRNEIISISRNFGVWEISVNNCGQTTNYTNAMWDNALKRIRKIKPTHSPQAVLMLGLGAGGQIKQIYKQFNPSHFVVVEYDHEMIRLTKELGLYKPFPLPHIVQGDAQEVLVQIRDSFDLIVVDLFHGKDPSPLATNEEFLLSAKKRLTPGGILLINVFEKKEYLQTVKEIFTQSETWKYRYNHLGAFWDNQKGE